MAPNTLLTNWAKEFDKWYQGIDVYKYHEGSIEKRLMSLRAVQRRGGVILSTYGLMQNHGPKMSTNSDDSEFVWDYVILDEAHKIKNPTKTTKAVHAIPAKFRLAVSGTPVQNNLKELFHILEWIMNNDKLFPSYADFKRNFETPIERSREKSASEREKFKGTLMAQNLREIYRPYFLRRTKDDVFSKRGSLGGEVGKTLPIKYDWVVWIKLTPEQIQIYEDILKSPAVKQALMGSTKSPLVQLTVLKKLCDHPYQLPRSTVERLLRKSRKTNNSDNIMNELIDEEDDDLVKIDGVEDSELIRTSGKLAFLVHLVEDLRQNGHRTLIFSQSTRMLDIIQNVLKVRRFKMARLDGRVKTKDREEIVTRFQASDEYEVMLLTTGVGGVGLTLTNADRVIIYDPCWNPATDSQAIDRAYRIGQDKPVMVYRLITCSTVEERIFRRQVFKSSIINQTVESQDNPTRYFTNTDIRELFKFTDPEVSETWASFERKHGEQRIPDRKTDSHRQFVISSNTVFNVSDHTFLFSLKDERDLPTEEEKEYIEKAVGREMVSMRSLTNNRASGDEYKSRMEQPVPVRNQIKKTPPPYVPLENPSGINGNFKREDSVIFAEPEPEILHDSDIQLIKNERSAKRDSDVYHSIDYTVISNGNMSLNRRSSSHQQSQEDASIEHIDLNSSNSSAGSNDSDIIIIKKTKNRNLIISSPEDSPAFRSKSSVNSSGRTSSRLTKSVIRDESCLEVSENDSPASSTRGSKTRDIYSDLSPSPIRLPKTYAKRSVNSSVHSTRSQRDSEGEASSALVNNRTNFADTRFENDSQLYGSHSRLNNTLNVEEEPNDTFGSLVADQISLSSTGLKETECTPEEVVPEEDTGSNRYSSVFSLRQSFFKTPEVSMTSPNTSNFFSTNATPSMSKGNSASPGGDVSMFTPGSRFNESAMSIGSPAAMARSPAGQSVIIDTTQDMEPEIFHTPSSVSVRRGRHYPRLSVVPEPLLLEEDETQVLDNTDEEHDDLDFIQSQLSQQMEESQNEQQSSLMTSMEKADNFLSEESFTGSDFSLDATSGPARTVSPEY